MNANRQKERISNFIKQTKTNETTAKKYLTKFNWDLENAVQQYNHDTKPPVPQTKPLENAYNKYKNPSSGDIEIEGIQNFCTDLGIEPIDPVILVISKYFNATVMGIYKKEEFTQGMISLVCDSVDKLKSKLPVLRRELSDPVKFKGIYNFVYGFSRETGMRNLSLESAVQLWRLLLGNRFPLLENWIGFLEKRERKYDISKDTWEMLLDFLEIFEREGLAGYDPSGAWPVLIDEFVEELSKSNN
ncbi:hypothetical protein SteCoe_5117 [Stentor coeruleus]|uniref:Defective in cullin neddylation protein n=1 Tax=Stentor coeruleus TaxID=5963 RepID=A0A1R2CSY5_9CILI|nr:hypothetical protein SteCoe_5117 [Stentor coeruleus]